MKKWFWKRLARFIVNRDWLVKFIIKTAKKRPYYHLDGYMERYWLMPSFLMSKDEFGNPHPYRWLPVMIRLHVILREDNERALHDHPFDFRTIILRGWYEEQDIFGQGFIRAKGDTVFHRAEYFHSIRSMPIGGATTLFIMGPRRNRRGFLVGGRKIHWKHYIGEQK